MKHCVLISPADSKLIEKLCKNDIDVKCTKSIDSFIRYERYHADMQIVSIHNTAFISESTLYLTDIISPYYNKIIVCNELGGKYPDNVSLNCALVGNHLICREKSVAPKIKEYCNKTDIEIINVNQGYAKCSTLVVSENAIITSDKGIYKQAFKHNIRSLLISEGYIDLYEEKYGFIGGCSLRVGDKVCFFGDINTHPDHKAIKEFIENEGLKPVSLIKDKRLNDIGGAVILK